MISISTESHDWNPGTRIPVTPWKRVQCCAGMAIWNPYPWLDIHSVTCTCVISYERLDRVNLPCLFRWHYHLVAITQGTWMKCSPHTKSSTSGSLILFTQKVKPLQHWTEFPRAHNLSMEHWGRWLKSRVHLKLANPQQRKCGISLDWCSTFLHSCLR